MTNPLKTIPLLTPVPGLKDTALAWVNQDGVDYRATIDEICQFAPAGPPGDQGPVGPTLSLGVGSSISGQSLSVLILLGFKGFSTTGFYVPGDGGGALYYYNTGSAQPGDQVSADGYRLSLSLSQQMTWEMLGAPTTGAICTASISGTTMTTSSVQSGAIAIGQTVTAIGATGSVSAGTVITAGSGTSWTVNNSQTVGPIVVCMNDSLPYLSAALQLGKYGLRSVGSHWFSTCAFVNTSTAPVAWDGPSGYTTSVYLAKFYFPAGYGGVVIGPSNLIVNAQGDVTLTGTASGSTEGSSFNRIAIQIGNGNLPAATVNNRPAVAVYSTIKWTNFRFAGADGDGLWVNSQSPIALADKCAFRDGTISNSWKNSLETQGGDSNVIDFQNIILETCGASSAHEHSFLGSGYREIQTQGCAHINAVVRRTNNLYYSIQDANINHDPTGSSGWWQLWQSSVGADTWDSGTTYQVGSSFRTSGNNNRSELVSCYLEGGTPPALFQSSVAGVFLTSVVGGLFGTGIDLVNGGYIGWNDGQFYANNVNAVRILGELPGTTPRNDVAATLTVGTSTQTQIWDGIFSNDRAVTLSTTGAVNGQSFFIIRTVASTGAFSLNVGTGPLKALAAGGWCKVLYNGSAWVLVASGILGVAAVAGAATASGLTMATARMLGRTTASTGAIEEITVGDGLSLSATNLKVAPAAAQADSVAVDVPGIVADFNSLLAKLRTAKFLTP